MERVEASLRPKPPSLTLMLLSEEQIEPPGITLYCYSPPLSLFFTLSTPTSISPLTNPVKPAHRNVYRIYRLHTRTQKPALHFVTMHKDAYTTTQQHPQRTGHPSFPYRWRDEHYRCCLLSLSQHTEQARVGGLEEEAEGGRVRGLAGPSHNEKNLAAAHCVLVMRSMCRRGGSTANFRGQPSVSRSTCHRARGGIHTG